MSKKLSEEQIKEFREAFLVFDKDGDGTVTVSEIGLVMKSLGQNPSEAEIKSMVQEVDTKGQGEIDFDDFCVLMQRMSGDSGESEDAYDETKETFKAFDKSGNDKITVSDLKSVLENLSVKLTTDELNGILEELESVGSELEYSDFTKIFMYA
ncbi:calmodulin-like [Rhopilema esculentum]|uniref:calmodulin-like n=1 Tax=Rhopilema esculentum TaxID=499914 RepID=UPI0031D6C9FE